MDMWVIARAASLATAIVASASELSTTRIPNVIPGLGALAGLVIAAADDSLPLRLAALAVVLAPGIVVFARGWLGGGALKLFAALALLLGLEPTLYLWVVLLALLLAALVRHKIDPLARGLPTSPALAIGIFVLTLVEKRYVLFGWAASMLPGSGGH